MKKIMMIALVAVAGACTKEHPYKELFKEKEVHKTNIDQSSLFIYMPSAGAASRSSVRARPYATGEGKLVKFRITEKSLQVYQIETDERFNDNSTNSKIVFEIPAEHVDYKCTEDQAGECTGKEEADGTIPWDRKSRLKLDFTQVKFAESNVVPIEVEKIFSKGCHSEVSSLVRDVEFSPTNLNFKIERTYRVLPTPTCAGQMRDLADLTTSSVFSYSIARLDTVTAADYKPVVYPREDENTFGFFTTETYRHDVDNRLVESSKQTLMNRWNPNRGNVVYHLSDEFRKPENAKIKQATYEAIAKVNAGLTAAGAKFQILINETPADIGDLRTSAIILVDDPSGAGLLGYGPSLANPLTGEIISARTVMYTGTLKGYLVREYDEVRRRVLKAKALEAAGLEALAREEEARQAEVKERASLKLSAEVSTAAEKLTKKAQRPFPMGGKVAVLDQNKLHSLIHDHHAEHSEVNILDRLAAKTKSCYFTADPVDFAKAIQRVLRLSDIEEMKAWEDLSSDEKKKLIDLMLPEVYIPVLIHELGHNLGLRHNFAGSEDSANFYTKKELAQMDIFLSVPRSTVMEYSGSEFRALPTMGKYDIAALRYGYAREVETKSGVMVKLDGTSIGALQAKALKNKELELKNYEFCTDEHVGLNAGCKRFDEGTTYPEMARHMIESYHDNHSRNFRRDQISLSLLDDVSYANRIYGLFLELRLFLEVYERIVLSGVSPDDPAWTDPKDPNHAFLAPIREAAVISGRFFLDVLTTPDATCVVENGETDDGLILQTLAKFGGDRAPLSCLGIELRSPYEMLGEFGKTFASRKSDKSNSNYIDQIDVRGIWIDKALAAKLLLGRLLDYERLLEKESDDDEEEDHISSLDDGHFNYFNLPELRPEIVQTLVGILANQYRKEVKVRKADGQVESVPLRVELYDSQLIQKPYSKDLARALGIPYRDTQLQEVILNHLVEESRIAQKENPGDVAQFDRLQAFGVYRVTPGPDRQINIPEGALVTEVNSQVIITNPENILGGFLVQQKLAFELLGQTPEAELKAIVAARTNNQTVPAESTQATKAIWSMPLPMIQNFIAGNVDTEFYSKMLLILPGL